MGAQKQKSVATFLTAIRSHQDKTHHKTVVISIYVETSKQNHHTLWLIIPLPNWLVTRISSAKQRQSSRLPDHSAGSANAVPPAVASCGNLGAVRRPQKSQGPTIGNAKNYNATKVISKNYTRDHSQMRNFVISHVGPWDLRFFCSKCTLIHFQMYL